MTNHETKSLGTRLLNRIEASVHHAWRCSHHALLAVSRALRVAAPPRPWRPLIVAWLVWIAGHTAAASDDWQWRPAILRLEFTTNAGLRQVLDWIGGTGIRTPMIDAEPQTDLRVATIRYRLLPTRVTAFATIQQVRNLEGFALPASHPSIRFKLTMRTRWGSAPKDQRFDEAGAVYTPWVAVGVEPREVAVPATVWTLQKGWDLVRIQVEVGAPGQFEDAAELPIAIRPFTGRAGWNVQHNIFNTFAAEHPRLTLWFVGGCLCIVVLGFGAVALHEFITWRRR